MLLRLRLAGSEKRRAGQQTGREDKCRVERMMAHGHSLLQNVSENPLRASKRDLTGSFNRYSATNQRAGRGARALDRRGGERSCRGLPAKESNVLGRIPQLVGIAGRPTAKRRTRRVSGALLRARASRNFGITSPANSSSEASAFSAPYHGGKCSMTEALRASLQLLDLGDHRRRRTVQDNVAAQRIVVARLGADVLRTVPR